MAHMKAPNQLSIYGSQLNLKLSDYEQQSIDQLVSVFTLTFFLVVWSH